MLLIPKGSGSRDFSTNDNRQNVQSFARNELWISGVVGKEYAESNVWLLNDCSEVFIHGNSYSIAAHYRLRMNPEFRADILRTYPVQMKMQITGTIPTMRIVSGQQSVSHKTAARLVHDRPQVLARSEEILDGDFRNNTLGST